MRKRGGEKNWETIVELYFMTYSTVVLMRVGDGDKKYTRLQLAKRRTGKIYDVKGSKCERKEYKL